MAPYTSRSAPASSSASTPDTLEKPQTVLDISSDVSTEGEGGLLSIAAEPDGDRLFVSYAGLDKRLHLEAISLDAPKRPASRRSCWRSTIRTRSTGEATSRSTTTGSFTSQRVTVGR